MSRNCDNPDCENLVPNLPSHHIRMGNSVFCSTKCKEEFFLWVVAVARQNPEIGVRARNWEKRGELRGNHRLWARAHLRPPLARSNPLRSTTVTE